MKTNVIIVKTSFFNRFARRKQTSFAFSSLPIVIGLGVLIFVMLAILIFVPARRSLDGGGPARQASEGVAGGPSPKLKPTQTEPPKTSTSTTMNIQSPAFQNNGSIPKKFTCDGENISPELQISGVPENAKSLALIMDDLDVPKSIRADGIWDHWLVWNIPPQITMIPEGTTPEGVVGKNTGGKFGYQGPCPPDREHRYFFKLYALDALLDLKAEVSRSELEAEIQKHLVAKTELIGLYKR